MSIVTKVKLRQITHTCIMMLSCVLQSLHLYQWYGSGSARAGCYTETDPGIRRGARRGTCSAWVSQRIEYSAYDSSLIFSLISPTLVNNQVGSLPIKKSILWYLRKYNSSIISHPQILAAQPTSNKSRQIQDRNQVFFDSVCWCKNLRQVHNDKTPVLHFVSITYHRIIKIMNYF